jgi:hypothetical protein
MEAALDNTLSRDGATPNTMSADIDMNSSGRIVNMLDAVNNQEPITLAQAAVIAGVTSPLTQDNVAAVLWPQSAIETANGKTATELQYYYGDVQRFGAKLDGATDDTTAFNNAIGSGYEAFVTSGTAAITGTILIAASQTLRCTSAVTLQRFAGAATTPIINQYGNLSRFFGGGCTIRQNLYDHPSGIVCFGHLPTDLTEGTASAVQCYNMQFWDAKIVGPEGSGPNAPILTGSPGFYVNSNRAINTGSWSSYPVYKCQMGGLQILNCDVNMEFSTDASSHTVMGYYSHQWTETALKLCGAYGNSFESPLADTTAKRYAVTLDVLGAGSESGRGIDAGWTIGGAYKNNFFGYSELVNGGTTNHAFFDRVTPAAGLYGKNMFQINGNLSGGIGKDGLSDAAALGDNYWYGNGVHKVLSGWVLDFGGFRFEAMDDGNGNFLAINGNVAIFGGREVAIAEGTGTTLFSMDGIGPNSAAAFIEVSYAAKMDAVSSGQVGKVTFAAWQETTGSFFVRKIAEIGTSFDEAAIVTPSIAMAAGDLSTEGKATVTFTTASPAGTNLAHITWKAEVISTESDANADLNDNLKIL